MPGVATGPFASLCPLHNRSLKSRGRPLLFTGPPSVARATRVQPSLLASTRRPSSGFTPSRRSCCTISRSSTA
eukprot:3748748-Prymnesium_polylepis.1